MSLKPSEERTAAVQFQSQRYSQLDMKLFLSDSPSDEQKVHIEIVSGGTGGRSFATCNFCVLGVGVKELNPTQDEHLFEGDVWRFPEFISRRELLDSEKVYLSEDVLYLRYEIVISNGDISREMLYPGPYPALEVVPDAKSGTNHNEKFNPSPGTLKDDLLCVLKDQSLSDFSLLVRDDSFPVHKTILGARSRVFKSMLANDMMEKTSGCMQIVDMDSDTVRQMLHFIYTDTLEDLQWESASKLYFAADKYEIVLLKQVCSSFLMQNLSNSNACELLALADLHQDKELKKTVQDFILSRDN